MHRRLKILTLVLAGLMAALTGQLRAVCPPSNVSVPANAVAGSEITVTFDEPIDPATFTPDDVTLLNPFMAQVPVISAVPVDGTGNATFLVTFDDQTVRGSYGLEIGPGIADVAGNLMNQNGNYQRSYSFKLTDEGTIDLVMLLSGIINDVLTGVNKGEIAAKFHHMLVTVIEEIAHKASVNSIAFSGGVFQNGLLVDLIIEKLSSNFNLYFHKELSPNDECISYGQLVSYYVNQKSNSNNE